MGIGWKGMLRVLTVIGARPQFVKAGPVSRALRKSAQEILVHTGQHYDPNMSDVFFKELELPQPDYNLGVGSGTHAQQTAHMMVRLEEIVMQERPDFVLVYGDTNSTLAGALVASKCRVPLAHVEAGLRSFNRNMPEETNRVLTDHVSDLLLAPTPTAVTNLEREGITRGVVRTGDVMADSLFAALRKTGDSALERWGLHTKEYILATIHRAESTALPESIVKVLLTLEGDGRPVIFPVHPRTRHTLAPWADTLGQLRNVRLVDPVGFLDMVTLEKNAGLIVTDSGGVQKEAFILGTRCITLRSETEWVETLENGWNMTIGLDPDRLEVALKRETPSIPPSSVFGSGDAATQIVRALESFSK